jgi:hypothetical protein
MSNQRAHSDGRTTKPELPRNGAAATRTRNIGVASLRKLPLAMASTKLTELRGRLKIAEETLRAIEPGDVDTLMVSGSQGDHAVTLKGGDPAYRMLVEAMSEGAATLSKDGAPANGKTT